MFVGVIIAQNDARGEPAAFTLWRRCHHPSVQRPSGRCLPLARFWSTIRPPTGLCRRLARHTLVQRGTMTSTDILNTIAGELMLVRAQVAATVALFDDRH